MSLLIVFATLAFASGDIPDPVQGLPGGLIDIFDTLTDDCYALDARSFCDMDFCQNLFWVDVGKSLYAVDESGDLASLHWISRMSCMDASIASAGVHAALYDFNVPEYRRRLGIMESIVFEGLLPAFTRFPFVLVRGGDRTIQAMTRLHGLLQTDAAYSQESVAASRALVDFKPFQRLRSMVRRAALFMTMRPFSAIDESIASFSQFALLVDDACLAASLPKRSEDFVHILAQFPPPLYRVPDEAAPLALFAGGLAPEPMIGVEDATAARAAVAVLSQAVALAKTAHTRFAALEARVPPTAVEGETFTSFTRLVKMLTVHLAPDAPHEALLLHIFKNAVCGELVAVVFWSQFVAEIVPAFTVSNHVVASLVSVCQPSLADRLVISALAPGRRMTQGQLFSARTGIAVTLPRDRTRFPAVFQSFASSGDIWKYRRVLIPQPEAVEQHVGTPGLRKDFLQVAMDHFMDPLKQGSLWTPAVENGVLFTVNTTTESQRLRTMGRLIGYAVRDGMRVGGQLAPSFIHALGALRPGEAVDLTALAQVEDPSTIHAMNNLRHLDWSSPDTGASLGLTFGDLVHGGNDEYVAAASLEEYIHLRVVSDFFGRRAEAIGSVLDGLVDVIGAGFVQFLSTEELTELLATKPALSSVLMRGGLERLAAPGHEEAMTRVFTWLLELLDEMEASQLGKFHEFVTASKYPPLAAGPWMKVTLVPSLAGDAFPRAHTCFNMLQLAPYGTKAMMKEKLLYAISETGSLEGHADYATAAGR